MSFCADSGLTCSMGCMQVWVRQPAGRSQVCDQLPGALCHHAAVLSATAGRPGLGLHVRCRRLPVHSRHHRRAGLADCHRQVAHFPLLSGDSSIHITQLACKPSLNIACCSARGTPHGKQLTTAALADAHASHAACSLALPGNAGTPLL